MKIEAARSAAELVARQRVAALGTTHAGAPSVTMAPFACLTDPFGFVVLVSHLASHTKDMLADARVALMIAAPETPEAPVHALARVSMQGTARPIREGADEYDAARNAYAARFPDMSALFTFADFGLFLIAPVSVRVVAGFAQAASISPEAFAEAVMERAGTAFGKAEKP